MSSGGFMFGFITAQLIGLLLTFSFCQAWTIPIYRKPDGAIYIRGSAVLKLVGILTLTTTASAYALSFL